MKFFLFLLFISRVVFAENSQIIRAQSPLILSNGLMSMPASSSSVDGYLTAANFNIFNNKAPSGNYITSLTGDVTGSGPGATATTIAKIQGTTVSGTTGTTNVVFSDSPSITGTWQLTSSTAGFGINSTPNISNIFVARRDQNQILRSIITNGNSGASAYVESSLSTDAGDFNWQATSIAGGALGYLATDSGFTGGLRIATNGTNPLDLRTNNTTGLLIDGTTQKVKIPTLTASTAVTTDGSLNLSSSLTTATELGYVHGVTSSIQTQINALQPAGNYITALTNDVTATGPGSVASTVAKIQGTTVSGTTGTTNVVFSNSPSITGTWQLTSTTGFGINVTPDTSNIFAARRDQNQILRSIITNGNTGSGAYVESSLSTNAGDFNWQATSVAGGALGYLATDSGFTGGLRIATNGANPLDLRTNNTTAILISGSQAVSLPAFSVAGVVHNNASGVLSSSLIVNADIDPSAAIAFSKMAALTAKSIPFADGSGFLTQDNTNLFYDSGTKTINSFGMSAIKASGLGLNLYSQDSSTEDTEGLNIFTGNATGEFNSGSQTFTTGTTTATDPDNYSSGGFNFYTGDAPNGANVGGFLFQPGEVSGVAAYPGAFILYGGGINNASNPNDAGSVSLHGGDVNDGLGKGGAIIIAAGAAANSAIYGANVTISSGANFGDSTKSGNIIFNNGANNTIMQIIGSSKVITLGASGFTGTHAVNGNLSISKSLLASDGLVGSPSISFANASTSGLYQTGATSFGVSAGGVQLGLFGTSVIFQGSQAGPFILKSSLSDSYGMNLYIDGSDNGHINYESTTGGLLLGTNGTDVLTITNNGSTIGGFRKDQNTKTALQLVNGSSGASANAEFRISTNADDFRIVADSTAGGADVNIYANSGFTGGLNIATLGANPLVLKTNNSAALSIDSSQNISVSAALKSSNYHIEPSEYDSGNSGTAQTIDWSTGSAQKSTLTGNVTYTFSNPVTGGAYVLKVATGAGSFTATWPSNVKWAGGNAPVITTTASRIDLINFYYDGTDFFGSYQQNYTP